MTSAEYDGLSKQSLEPITANNGFYACVCQDIKEFCTR